MNNDEMDESSNQADDILDMTWIYFRYLGVHSDVCRCAVKSTTCTIGIFVINHLRLSPNTLYLRFSA